LFADDFRQCKESKDWPTTMAHLWVPFNEHLIPFARVLTFLITRPGVFSGPESACALTGMGLFVVVLALLFVLLVRLTGEEYTAAILLMIFAISLAYEEVIMWYSASLWLLPTILLLVALLGLESKTRLGMMGTVLASLLGPWNFSLGVLVGPIAASWAWLRFPDRKHWWWPPLLAGMLSTMIVLRILVEVVSTADYTEAGGRGFRAFDPVEGTVVIARLMVDRLVLLNLGYRQIPVPIYVAAGILVLMAVGLAWLLRRYPSLWAAMPGVIIMMLGYVATIPFRTWEPYPSLLTWSRYQLLPQLGMVIAWALARGQTDFRRQQAWYFRSAIVLVLVVSWTLLQALGLPRWPMKW
jgi:hypothetical protein